MIGWGKGPVIPNVIGRIDPIVYAIRDGNWEEAQKLAEAECARLTEARDKLDAQWRAASGKSIEAYRFVKHLAKADDDARYAMRLACGYKEPSVNGVDF